MKKFICPVNKAACQKFIAAAGIKSNLKSVLVLQKALDLIGKTRNLARAFDGNPSFVWLPDPELGALSQGAFVYVYDRESAHLLVVLCDDVSDVADIKADSACAIAAAKTAYNNITT